MTESERLSQQLAKSIAADGNLAVDLALKISEAINEMDPEGVKLNSKTLARASFLACGFVFGEHNIEAFTSECVTLTHVDRIGK